MATIPLLQSLLTNPSLTTQFQSIPIDDRISSLASILLQSQHDTKVGDDVTLLCVTLLRRDLSRVCANVSAANDTTGSANSNNGYSSLLTPLLDLFETTPGHSRTKRMVGRCVAELCGEGNNMEGVLKRIGAGVSLLNG